MKSKIVRIRGTETDEELVELSRTAISGDMRAFEVLVARHQRGILANCRSLAGRSDDSEDLAQEVFVKAYFGLETFAGRSKFRSWLQRIKINHCLNHLRKSRGKTFLDVDDPAVQGADPLHVDAEAEASLHAKEGAQSVHGVLAQLPDSLRIPLVMCDMDGCAYKEIADHLGIGLSATKMRIKRAREAFREKFQAWQRDSQALRGVEDTRLLVPEDGDTP